MGSPDAPVSKHLPEPCTPLGRRIPEEVGTIETLGTAGDRGGGIRLLPVALGALGVLGALWAAPWLVPGPTSAFGVVSPGKASDPEAIVLFRTNSAADLARMLDEAWEETEAAGTVPRLAPVALPRDMERLEPETRKRTFLRAVAPHLLAVNRRIAVDRREIAAIGARRDGSLALSEHEIGFLGQASVRYGVQEAETLLAAGRPAAACALLLDHVDEVPVKLALAQAAIESGWGASRLAREHNSLFGQRVNRPTGGTSEGPGPDGLWYARFETLRGGVEAYVRNLNRFWAYREFRTIRAAMRKAGAPLDSMRLAGALRRYSELGECYVDRVRTVIRDSQITAFSEVRLVPVPSEPFVEEASREVLALEAAEGSGGPRV